MSFNAKRGEKGKEWSKAHSLAIKLLKTQDLSTGTCFHWATLSHFRYFLMTHAVTQPSLMPRAHKEEIQRRNSKNRNWDSPFWRNCPTLTHAKRKTGNQKLIAWGISTHPHQSNTGTGLLTLILDKNRNISEQYIYIMLYIYVYIYRTSKGRANKTDRSLKAAVILHHFCITSIFLPPSVQHEEYKRLDTHFDL